MLIQSPARKKAEDHGDQHCDAELAYHPQHPDNLTFVLSLFLVAYSHTHIL